MTGPPDSLVNALVERGLVSGLEWYEVVSSTNTVAAEAVERRVREIHAVVANEQIAGRGRLGRTWHAPPGTSLTCSLVLRPSVARNVLSLIPLLTGLVLVETVDAFHPGVDAALKWPNDLLVKGRKAGGILVEAGHSGAVIVGIGVNVDWRGVQRPPGLECAISLAEAMGWGVDRWDVLATLLTTFNARYRHWNLQPTGFLAEYGRRCATLGKMVRVSTVRGSEVTGHAAEIARDGALVVGLPYGRTIRVTAGDVEHVR
jgi:BirA family biotin operon repressor/biotin-[acetyl-CoA-carboxylase] ligase